MKNKLNYNNLIDWLTGQTMPVIEEENDDKFSCYYAHDIEDWLHSVIYRNKQPTNWD